MKKTTRWQPITGQFESGAGFLFPSINLIFFTYNIIVLSFIQLSLVAQMAKAWVREAKDKGSIPGVHIFLFS